MKLSNTITMTLLGLMLLGLVACTTQPTVPGQSNQNTDTQRDNDPNTKDNPQDTPGLRTIVNTRVGDLSLSYVDGKMIMDGTLQRSTPCVNWQADVIVMESFPEQVRISIEDQSTAEMCIQVLGEPQDIHAQAMVSEEARITILLEGEPVFEGQLG